MNTRRRETGPASLTPKGLGAIHPIAPDAVRSAARHVETQPDAADLLDILGIDDTARDVGMYTEEHWAVRL